jgi:hypothetical protein
MEIERTGWKRRGSHACRDSRKARGFFGGFYIPPKKTGLVEYFEPRRRGTTGSAPNLPFYICI